MEDTSLVYCVTAFGTRKSCDLAELLLHVGKAHREQLFQQLERLERAGIIYCNGNVVSLKNSDMAQGVKESCL